VIACVLLVLGMLTSLATGYINAHPEMQNLSAGWHHTAVSLSTAKAVIARLKKESAHRIAKKR
jgi:hypothetical protein